MLTVRRADLADVPALSELLSQLFAGEVEFHPDDDAQRRGLALIIGGDGIGRVLIGEKNGRPAGMVNMLYTVSTALGGRVAILEDVVIDKSARGHGHGKALLAAAIEAARADGCLRITLLTDSTNARAHHLYKSYGFVRSAMCPFRLMLPRTLTA